MKIKQVEIRDRATLVPALAVQVSGEDGPLIRTAGFSNPMVVLIHLSVPRCEWDPYEWENRTMRTAHLWLADHFDTLPDRGVVDVEYVLGERDTPKAGLPAD